jgi:hypothetical protein
MTTFCAGIIDNNIGCTKRSQCALYRLWWETPKTDMHLCHVGKFNLFIPLRLEPATPKAVQAFPIGKTMELFA